MSIYIHSYTYLYIYIYIYKYIYINMANVHDFVFWPMYMKYKVNTN